MIVFADQSSNIRDRLRAELAPVFTVEQLMTPLSQYKWWGEHFAIDNGAFARFDAAAYTRLLAKMRPHRGLCRYATAPDVVGSARRTLEVFRHWYPKLEGFPIALVLQEGIEDFDLPWHLIGAVFVGGGDQFKTSRAATDVVKAAQAMGKWVHCGRCNGGGRLRHFWNLRIDSIDGNGIGQHEDRREDAVALILSLKDESQLPLFKKENAA